MDTLLQLVRLMRPHQWIKNGFILTGLVFGHAWADGALVQHVLIALAAFSLLSSAIYILNDIVDIEADRAHPTKRARPLPAGLVSVPLAFVAAATLLGLALALGYWVSVEVLVLQLAYVVINVAYSAGLKHVPILDVFMIAAGFMLRILVGTVGVGIAPSKWLLLCGLMATLFLGFAKRYAELAVVEAAGKGGRRVLIEYDRNLLDSLIGITATATVISYGLYTVSPETVRMHDTDALIYTVPFVLYGIMRYLYKLHRHHAGEDPSRELMRDPHLIVTVLVWLGVVIYLLGR